ncbi:uncharacterized protein EV422DRAFT_493934 [Fimicolochytrium jonesii]|uniref:uncharacterized protein n=1 Tax=Fimicolochytrium jonesii TaxID=1396493 RepID=UPI0022FDF257|nr:uncharacterized protein EV422DRAFT_493934 [Fimicolochytrium jonesii]KAI8823392.1 hypothetical protein EV422DRAFT_493934 [Fimicolochytrium jonesii]
MEISGPPPEGPKPTFRSYSVKRPNGPPPKPNAAGNQQQQSGSKVSKVSLEKTLEMYRMNALKSGDDRLRFDFAKYLLDESGKTTDNALKDKLSEEAFALLKELSKAGNPDAMFTLGQAYFEDTQYTLAHPQLLAAAKRSHPGAMYLLGVLSEKGAGTKKSTKISMDFYTKSAQAGYRPALYRLGMIEYQGLLGTKRDVRKAVMWFKRGAAVADTEHPECLYELAKIYEEGVPPHIQQDEGYALGLYKEASELEYPPAQNVLASCYEFGRLGCAKDLVSALYWYGRAAEHGHPEAQFVLAGWYLHGFPPLVPKNESEAYAWTYRAAKQNHAESQYAIGFFCEAGIGCQKSLEKAVVWYQLASGRGEKRAEERLRELREENPGMPALAPQVVKEGKGMFGFLKK